MVSVFLLGALLYAADPAVEQARKKIADKKYDEAISSLEAAHKAKPKSVEVQKALGDAYVAKADSFMYNDALPPRQKYPTALKAYRQALAYDSDNKKAKEGVSTIEGIYKSMGRPVPQ
jgi:tetratricopeptide (TPR) repeat protein